MRSLSEVALSHDDVQRAFKLSSSGPHWYVSLCSLCCVSLSLAAISLIFLFANAIFMFSLPPPPPSCTLPFYPSRTHHPSVHPDASIKRDDKVQVQIELPFPVLMTGLSIKCRSDLGEVEVVQVLGRSPYHSSFQVCFLGPFPSLRLRLSAPPHHTFSPLLLL